MNTNNIPEILNPVEDALTTARLVAWDGCHKIYVAMDDTQAKWFRESDYDFIVSGTPDDMMDNLIEWWEESCPLRFVQAVFTTNGEDDYEVIVPQFAEEI